MSTATVSEQSGSAPARRRAGGPARAAAGLGGILLFFIGLIMTFGVAAFASIGVLLAWWVKRLRRGVLTRAGAWIAAACSAAVVIIVGSALIFVSLPDGFFEEAMAAAEAADPPPQPEWLERLAPQGAPPDPMTERVISSKPFTIYFGVMGGSIMVLLMASIAGTFGWGAILLLGFAVRGYWPLFRRPVEDDELTGGLQQ